MITLNNNGTFYIEMSDKEKSQTILKHQNKYINKIQILYNMLYYCLYNYESIYTEGELRQINQAIINLNQLLVSLKKNFREDFNLYKFQDNMKQFIDLEKSTKNISFKVLKHKLTSPDQFYSGQSFTFVVHVPTKGTNNSKNEKFPITSASLITDRSMGLYEEGYGKYGYILDFDIDNFIVSSTADLYSSFYPQDEFNKEDYYLQFYKNDMYVIETDEELFQMSETCIAIPHYMEQVNLNTTIAVNGEPLNYDKEEIYNEIVLLNNENLKKIGVFVRTNGDKNFNIDYLKAKELAKKEGIPLIEIDKSLYREKIGLKPLTTFETNTIIDNIFRRIKKNIKLYSLFQKKYNELAIFYNSIGKKYTIANFCLELYNNLRKYDILLSDEELYQYINRINKNYMDIQNSQENTKNQQKTI